MRAALALAVALVACEARNAPPPPEPSPERVEAARRLFRRGLDADARPITARLAGGGELTGEFAACARCHGADALGRTEGGYAAPALGGGALLRAGAGPVPRPAYDPQTFRRALTEGVGAGGAPLDAVMPRYTLSDDATGDLWRWLRESDRLDEPGVTPTTLRVECRVPAAPTDAADRAFAAAFRGVLDAADAGGGLYRRRFEAECRSDAAPGPPALLRVVARRAQLLDDDRTTLLALEALPPEAETTGPIFALFPAPATLRAAVAARVPGPADGRCVHLRERFDAPPPPTPCDLVEPAPERRAGALAETTGWRRPADPAAFGALAGEMVGHLVVEAARRAGAHPSADGVREALESLRGLPVGQGWHATYSRGRRVAFATWARLTPDPRGGPAVLRAHFDLVPGAVPPTDTGVVTPIRP